MIGFGLCNKDNRESWYQLKQKIKHLPRTHKTISCEFMNQENNNKQANNLKKCPKTRLPRICVSTLVYAIGKFYWY